MPAIVFQMNNLISFQSHVINSLFQLQTCFKQGKKLGSSNLNYAE